MKLNIGKKITGLEIETLNCEISSLCYTVYWYVLQSRQVGRTFKLVNPNDSQSSLVSLLGRNV